MASRFLATKLTVAALAGLMTLASCGLPAGSDPALQGTPGADEQLVQRASIMGRTVLEGAALGWAVDEVGTRVVGSPIFGMSVTTTAGAVTGTYLGYLQQRFLAREDVLTQVRSDLDQNSAQIAATISVMRSVLAVQQTDLARLRAEAQAGAVAPEALAAGVSAAQANLAEMQRAINGATSRQAEFASARSLLPSGGGSDIDPELSALSNQIAEMRAIASDLSENL